MCLFIVVYILFFKFSAHVPGSAQLFAGAAVGALGGLEDEAVRLVRVDLAVSADDRFICQGIHDLADDAEAGDAVLQLQHLAFEGHRELLKDRGIHIFALHGVEAAPGHLVRHVVPGDGAHIVRLGGMGAVRHSQREGHALGHIVRREMALLQIERHLVEVAEAAPGHGHGVRRAVVIVRADHEGRHGIEIRFDS